MANLEGTWLYLGKFDVAGGTGSSPVGGTAARKSFEGIEVGHKSGLSFVEVSWNTNSDGFAYPKHNEIHDKYHSASYELDGEMVETKFASFLHYKVELTFLSDDKTTYTVEKVYTARQMMNGDLFVTTSYDNNGPDGTKETFADPLLTARLTELVDYGDWNMRVHDIRDFKGEVVPPSVPCFVGGTLIDTPDGPRVIEDIRVGDLVWTQDHGAQPVRWVGSRRMGEALLTIFPKLRPIRIGAGTLGAGVPASDLFVSPQHRILVRSKIAERMFGKSEVLIAAKDMLEWPGVALAEDLHDFSYHHLLFDRHELIRANGLLSESLFTGEQALIAVGAEARTEILTILPQLQTTHHIPAPARSLEKGHRVRHMIQRHLKSDKPLFAG